MNVRDTSVPGSGVGLAVISGGASGIGLATAEVFLAAGYAALVLDRDADAMTLVDETLGHRYGDRLALHRIDLLEDDLGSVVARLRPGNLHLINNLGGSAGPKRPFDSLSWRDFEAAFSLNLKATVRLTQAALPVMRARSRGWIVNVASIAGRAALPYVAADYAAAKTALLGLTRTMASELASSGILVNAICPGIVSTARIRKRWAARSEADNASMMGRIPLGRLGTAEEIARACLFLGSSANTYVTGAVLDANGGAHLP